MSINTVTIVGRVVRRPECRYTAGADPVADISVAVNERKKGTDGSTRDTDASFFDCVVWGAIAEACAKHLDKGDLVGVQGRLQQQRWESKDGQKRSKVVIRAFHVEFLRVQSWAQGHGGGASHESEYQPESENQSAPEHGQEALANTDQDDLPF